MWCTYKKYIKNVNNLIIIYLYGFQVYKKKIVNQFKND